MRNVSALAAGALFGLGLLVSGMTDTVKVQAWLDIFGAWDLSLAFVLGFAVLPMVLVWRIAARMTTALSGAPIPPMPKQVIDARLIGGSALFGAGWAITGFCPGPAAASLSFGGLSGLVFMAAMLVGMVAARHLPKWRDLTGRLVGDERLELPTSSV